MPTVNTKNIMVGAGHLYITKADAPAALPAAPATTAGPPPVTPSYKTALDADTNWRYVGATDGGVEVSWTSDIGEVAVDQLKDSALIFNTGQTATVGTGLAEPTLANLMVSWGLRSTDLVGAGDTLNLGAMPDDLPERSIALVGNAPKQGGLATAVAKRERVYYGRRVVSVDGGAHTLSRTDATTLPVSFRLLPDTSVSGAEYGTMGTNFCRISIDAVNALTLANHLHDFVDIVQCLSHWSEVGLNYNH